MGENLPTQQCFEIGLAYGYSGHGCGQSGNGRGEANMNIFCEKGLGLGLGPGLGSQESGRVVGQCGDGAWGGTATLPWCLLLDIYSIFYGSECAGNARAAAESKTRAC